MSGHVPSGIENKTNWVKVVRMKRRGDTYAMHDVIMTVQTYFKGLMTYRHARSGMAKCIVPAIAKIAHWRTEHIIRPLFSFSGKPVDHFRMPEYTFQYPSIHLPCRYSDGGFKTGAEAI